MSEPTQQPASPKNGAVLPNHVAIIMDGNGRWARRKGMPRVAGHRKGVEAIRKTIEEAARQGISWLTVFAFSSENWRRPKQEVDRLMELFVQALDKDVAELHKNGMRFQVIGNITSMSDSIQNRIRKSQELTSGNDGMVLTVALNYGGRWDIAQACRKISQEVRNGECTEDRVDDDLLQSHLSTAGMPDPDLFIRTGGEKRISNFLLWQLAYTELYFTDVLWPDFGPVEFMAALDWFTQRQRRYGQTGEQVEAL